MKKGKVQTGRPENKEMHRLEDLEKRRRTKRSLGRIRGSVRMYFDEKKVKYNHEDLAPI